VTEGPTPLTYAVVTPVRNEEEHLEQLAQSLAVQTRLPREWVIVDTGSEDGTASMAGRLGARHPWVRLLLSPQPYARGGPIVRAFQAGVSALAEPVDVVVKLDADITLDPGYFEELLRRFAADPTLGIASGTCLEQEGGRWVARRVTADHVWGCCRAYRADCFAEVAPLEERMGWDGIDAFKASARGWTTGTLDGLSFRHHRPEGSRDGRLDRWRIRGDAAHYMGYRPSFLVLRSIRRAREDPAALAMLVGFAAAAARREPRIPDPSAVATLRRQQRFRELPLRALETFGRGHRRPA
jgi:glycosyltransferase involved in cell wall biosynthesis